MATIKCKFCGKTDNANRRTKAFCSDACRIDYWKISKKFLDKRKEIEAAMQFMMAIVAKYPEFTETAAGDFKLISDYADSIWRKENNRVLELAKQKSFLTD